MTRRLNFLPLCVIFFCNSLVFFAPAAILVRTRCGITLPQFFLLQAILSCGIFLFEIPCGWLTDRIGYKKSIILSQTLLAITRIFFLVGGNFVFFVIEAVAEALGICFSSGTMESYIYESSGRSPEITVKRQSILSNFSESAFILSTLAFAPLSRFFSIEVLIALTLAASSVSLISAFFIPSFELRISKKCDFAHNSFFRKLIFDRNVIALFLISSFTSLAEIVVNFVYILKVQKIGLNPSWMTGLILAYTGLGLVTPLLVRHILKFRPAFFICASMTASAFLSALIGISSGLTALAPMILLPFSISLAGLTYSALVNRIVDSMELEGNRAEIFSVLNQGSNLIQIVFLFAAGFVEKISLAGIFVCVAVMLFFAALIPFCFRANQFFERLED